MRSSFVRGASLLAGFATLTLVFVLLGQSPVGAKPPAPPPPPPPAPPVKYQLHFFNSPAGNGGWINDFNNKSQACGWYLSGSVTHAWYYDPQVHGSTTVDLNSLGLPVPEGWFIESAIGLNEKGAIAGRLANLSDQNNKRACILDMTVVGDARLTLLPDEAWTSSRALDINDQGMVLGSYVRADGMWGFFLFQSHLYGQVADTAVRDLGVAAKYSDPAAELSELSPVQFAGSLGNLTSFRFTDGGQLENFSNVGVQGVNQWGALCGASSFTTNPPKGRSVTTTVPVRVMAGEGPQQFTDVTGSAYAINSRGDLAIGKTGVNLGNPRFIRWDTFGVFDLNDMVVGDSGDLTTFKDSVTGIVELNDPPNANGFGEVIGRIAVNSQYFNQFFYLTPVAP